MIVLSAYGTPAQDVAIFAGYVIFGLALPGMLWVRLLRRTSSHLAEDLALGLAVGYCLELVAYLAARAIGVPLLFLVWVVVTYAVFATPNLRRYWRGSGERVPTWWSWALAAMLAYVLIFSAGSFFQQHHLTGSDTPYVDMPYHLALIGELKHHLPPLIPYVSGVPLAYHWFVYADSAAVSWATGIEPATLLYRLFALPMFVVFVLLTAVTARRLTGGWGSGPVAVAVAMFGSVAAPYRWADGSVFDTQTLLTTWMSPTNLFGLALFAAAILMFVDLLQADSQAPRTRWLVIGLLVFGVAGAKATLLPLLIVGLATVLVGDVISRRRLHKGAVGGLAVALIGLIVATTVLYRGESVGLAIGLGALRSFPVAVAVGAQRASGRRRGWSRWRPCPSPSCSGHSCGRAPTD